MCAYTQKYIYFERQREKDITQSCAHDIINNFIFNYAVVYGKVKILILNGSYFNTKMAHFETLIKEQSRFLRQVMWWPKF